MEETKELITTDDIRSKVYIIRGQQVMLDKDLAEIYGYDVKRLNEQVKRNINRFPEDFMFQLKTSEITESLKSQIATLNVSKNKRGMHIKKMPFAFTEQGIYMLATVLRGELAEQQSIFIMRTFREMRHYIKMKKLKKRFIVPAVEVKPFLKKFTEETRKFYCKGEERAFTISLGFAEYPVLADDRSQLMRCADMALYEVKMSGKNGCMAYREGERIKSRAKLGFAVKDIIDNMPGAFIVYRADKENDEILLANNELLRLTGCKNMDELLAYTIYLSE